MPTIEVVSMQMWKLTILLAISLMSSRMAKACDDYGCGDAWGGLYSVGDYNLYQFGTGLYDIGNAFSGYSSYGGSCGSLISTCSGGYDSGNLYGNSWGVGNSGGSIDIGINIDIVPTYTNVSNSCNACGVDYSFLQGSDVGCSVGYCDSNSYLPYPGSNYGSNNPWYNPWDNYFNQIPSSPYFPPNYSTIPRDPYQNPYFPPVPPTTPPYGVCDNIIVMCPTGIVNRPNPIPGTGYNIPRDPFSPPTYPPTVYPPTYPPVTAPPSHTDPFYPPVAFPGTRYQLPRDPGYPVSPIAPINYPPVVNDPIFAPSPITYPTVPPTTFPPSVPPTTFPPLVNVPVTPPTFLPPINTVPVNPPVPTVPALIGSQPGSSNSNFGSLPPVRNQVPRAN